MASINIKVDKFTVQYMLKSIDLDTPLMLPLTPYSVELNLEIPDELAPFVPAYIKGFSGTDPEAAEARIIPEYNAPRETVKKWKDILIRDYPDSFIPSTKPDMIIDSAIGCTLEDAIKDSLETLWDKTLEAQLNASPEIPEGYRKGTRFINLVKWSVVQ
jgi:hypothetical protein